MIESFFAPAERLNRDQIDSQRMRLKEAVGLTSLIGSLDSAVLVLNRQRQIVEGFMPAGQFGEEELIGIGLRPGEAMGCVHAPAHPGGCGTTPACRYCGVVQAVQECIEEQIPVKRLCSLRLGGEQRESGAEYQVTALPFPFHEEFFILLFFENRTHEQRRRVMERLFFHDVLNTASGLKMHLELLARREITPALEQDVRKILDISQTLIDEIDDQKILAGAENGTLQVRRDFIHSIELLTSLSSQYAVLAEKRGVVLQIESFSEAFLQLSDGGLLRRVVGNMVKNAIEASSAGETVILSCREEKNRRIFSVWNPAVMDDEARQRVFTRSFSTKGENRGLGTYSMKLLGEGYLGGMVRCVSLDGEGTTFSITFAAAE